MKTILLKRTSALTGITIILLFFFSSCKKNTETAVPTQPIQPVAPLEFVHFTIDNVDTSFTSPADSIIYHGNGESGSPISGVSAIHYQGTDSNFVAFNFTNVGMAQGSVQSFYMIIQTGWHVSYPAVPINVNITEYGIAGQHVSGNFSGEITDGVGSNHIVSGDFRAKRYY